MRRGGFVKQDTWKSPSEHAPRPVNNLEISNYSHLLYRGTRQRKVMVDGEECAHDRLGKPQMQTQNEERINEKGSR